MKFYTSTLTLIEGEGIGLLKGQQHSNDDHNLLSTGLQVT